MNKSDAEKIIKDTIEYANGEIERSKKKYLRVSLLVIGIFVFLISLYFWIFKYEVPVKYNDKLIKVNIPSDGGIDVSVNLDNYKRVKAVLVKINDNEYDLYINITSTLFTNLFLDNDKSDNILRVGNGIIVDFQSGELNGYMPNGYKSDVIKNIYYIDNLSKRISSMDDNKLINYKDKVLVWSR